MSDSTTDTVELINSRRAGFSKLLGLVVTEATADCVKATLEVRDELCTRPEVLHGGAIMAFADNLGALACILNLPEGASTTTLESKTNFLSSIPMGQTAVCPIGIDDKKFVLLSNVVVDAPSGKFNIQASAPKLSAKAMIAPPCKTSGRVHNSSRTSSVALTQSAVASVTTRPKSFENPARRELISSTVSVVESLITFLSIQSPTRDRVRYLRHARNRGGPDPSSRTPHPGSVPTRHIQRRVPA